MKKPQYKVIIYVKGGTAVVGTCPDNVHVVIKDDDLLDLDQLEPRKRLRAVDLSEFSKQYGLSIDVCRPGRPYNSTFCARFSNAEVKEGALLRGVFGDGNTTRAAIRDYARKISNKLLVIDAMKASRREIQVPKLKA